MELVIEHDGCTISQTSYNNHVTAFSEDGMVFHASCNRKMNEEELIALYESQKNLYEFAKVHFGTTFYDDDGEK